MHFTSIPDNYSPLAKPLLYGFVFDAEQKVVDVKIVDVTHDRTLGVRRFYDMQSGEIDIAPYLKRCFDPKPVDGGTAIVDAEGFYFVIAVEVNGERSESRYFSPYSIRDGEGTIFRSAVKRQTLARDESDCIILYAPNGGHVGCELYASEQMCGQFEFEVEYSPGLQILKIEPTLFDVEFDTMIINVGVDGIEDFLTYRIVDNSELSRRLMWCDADGMLQFYTFPTCRSRHSRVTKQHLETEQGLRVTSCEVESLLTLVSDYETVAEMERLGNILESEFVWLDRGVDSVRVDVVSTESIVRYGGALNSLQVDIRAYNRKEARV